MSRPQGISNLAFKCVYDNPIPSEQSIPVVTFTEVADQLIIIDNATNVAIDVDVLANAFNLSKQEFLSSKLYGKYTPMSIDDVAELMEKYPDWVMVVDKIRDLNYLHKHLPYHDRMIVQVFALHNYFKALQLGYKYPTLRLKGGRRGVKEIYKVLMDIGNVKSVILGEKSFNKNKEYIGQLHDKGVTVILYGNPSYQIVDNPEAIKANLYKYLDLIDSDHLSKLD